MENTPQDLFSEKTMKSLSDLTLSYYAQWDQQWPEIQKNIESQGHNIQCRESCSNCCFSRKSCSLSEGMTILDYMQKHFSPERQEHFRLRVESNASSLAKLQGEGVCESDESFGLSGGLECPFLEQERCAIYPVRPLECRWQYMTTEVSLKNCRFCPHSVACQGAETQGRELQKELMEKERLLFPAFFTTQDRPSMMISQTLSTLWAKGAPSPAYFFTKPIRQNRLASRKSCRDETWRDDRRDLQIVHFPLSLPDEGDYPPNLTLLKQHLEVCEIYDQKIYSKNFPEFYTLYKRHPRGVFDWDKREFQWKDNDPMNNALSYTCWMSDDLQERLMMWEAAKRARGRVLCGGLGLGLFPQMALALTRIRSVDVVEMDTDVIRMIQMAWGQKPWARMSDCKIINAKIEAYLTETKEKYDTIYIDTWDAIYHEYLPHLNELTERAKRLLNPGGEVLLWAFDMKVRAFLQTAKSVTERRQKYLKATKDQMANIEKKYPLLFKLVTWLRMNPRCSDENIQNKAYHLATQEAWDCGVLKLSHQTGAQELLENKYFTQFA